MVSARPGADIAQGRVVHVAARLAAVLLHRVASVDAEFLRRHFRALDAVGDLLERDVARRVG